MSFKDITRAAITVIPVAGLLYQGLRGTRTEEGESNIMHEIKKYVGASCTVALMAGASLFFSTRSDYSSNLESYVPTQFVQESLGFPDPLNISESATRR